VFRDVYGTRDADAVKTNRRAMRTAQTSDARETHERDAVRAMTVVDAMDARARA